MGENKYIDLIRWIEEWAPEVEFHIWGIIVSKKTRKLREATRTGKSSESFIIAPINDDFYRKYVLPSFQLNFRKTASIARTIGGYIVIHLRQTESGQYDAIREHLSKTDILIIHANNQTCSFIPREEWEKGAIDD